MVTLHPDIDDRGFIPIPLTRKDLPNGLTIAMDVYSDLLKTNNFSFN
jgi:hypothetical protein